MADERDLRRGRDLSDVGELDLDLEGADLESAMRDAVAAVEEVESAHGGGTAPGAAAPAPAGDLQRENEELRGRLMRALADFDNLRKRTERERQELRRYALFEAMREIVNVADNLERAAAAAGSAEDVKAGVELILKQMRELLRRHGVTAVEAVGRPFDPTEHEAVSREESAEVSSPTVVAELQRGYRMHDRLLRPAMVRVSVPSERDEQDPRHRSRDDE